MKKLEQITNWQEMINEVVHADCYDFLAKIPDNTIDLCIIDPPYQIDDSGGGGTFGSKNRQYHRDMEKDKRAFKKGFSDDVLDEIVRVSKKVNVYIFCNKNQILQILSFFKDYNFDILTFIKTNPTPMCNNKYLSDTEYIIFARDKGVKLYGTYETKKKYFLQNIEKNIFDHPTVKPLNIIETLIENSSLENDLVLDCFGGSFTTARACKTLKRNFLSCEIEKKYCEIGENRLSQNNLF